MSFESLFSRGGLSLERLRVIVELAGAKSLAAAAGYDATRQSQFSRQIKELESFFEIELVRREGRALRLTPAGFELAAAVRQGLQSLEDFTSRHGGVATELGIAAGQALIQWVLARRLGKLLDLSKSFKLRFHNSRSVDIVRGLQGMDLDFGLVRRSALSRDLRSRPLGRVASALFVPRQLLPPERRTTEKTLLSSVPLASLNEEGEYVRQLRSEMNHQGVVLDVRLECSSYTEAAAAVASGALGAILPDLVEPSFVGADVVRVELPWLRSLVREIHLAWNPRLLKLRPDVGKLLGPVEDVLRWGER